MRHRSRIAALGALLAVLATACVAPNAGAATACGKKVLDDWSDNSRIDGVYSLHCYEEGIDAIPADIRDYTNAAEVISRAFQSRTGRQLAIRERENGGSKREASDPPLVDASSSVPVPLLVLGGMSLALLAAGGLGYVARRRQPLDDGADDEEA
jgi:hypothetical protein